MHNNDSSSSKSLILITNHYPFGLAEAFLDHEISYLTNSFDKVIIVARDITSPDIRKKNKDFSYHRLNPESNASEKLITVFLSLARIAKIAAYISEEITAIRKETRLRFAVIRKLFHDLGKAIVLAHQLEKIIASHRLKGTVVIYSYWLNNSALAATLIKSGNLHVRLISRAHGVDVYESRNPLNYLSFRNTLSKQLDKIFCISENGVQHLRTKTDQACHQKIRLSRLGTFHAGEGPSKTTAGIFHIVSCSFLLPIKQVHLIIEALSMVEGLKLHWSHIGDGPLRKELELLAGQKLSSRNVSYSFLGAIENSVLMQFYRDNYIDVFVNASASEGVPVTMMEAQSFGIPIIAPAVGGVSEIVTTDTGLLLEAKATPADIANAIRDVLLMERLAYDRLRINAFRSWDRKYNAEKNFPTFVSEILSL